MNVILRDYVVKTRINQRMDAIDVTQMPPGLDQMVAGEQSVSTIDAGGVFATGERAMILAETTSDPSRRNLKGLLRKFGIDEDASEEFLGGLKSGGLLFWMTADDSRAGEATALISEHKAKALTLNP